MLTTHFISKVTLSVCFFKGIFLKSRSTHILHHWKNWTWLSIENRQLTREANPLVEFGWPPKTSNLKHTSFCALILWRGYVQDHSSVLSLWPWCTAWGCQESPRESVLGGFPGPPCCCFQAFSLKSQAGQQASLAWLASPALQGNNSSKAAPSQKRQSTTCQVGRSQGDKPKESCFWWWAFYAPLIIMSPVN